MAKFGELIKSEKPILMVFYAEWNESSNALQSELVYVANELDDLARVIKINVEINQDLCDALRIKSLPTIMVYKESQMLFRQAREFTPQEVKKILTEYL